MELLVLKGLRQYAGGGANGLAGIFTSYVQVEMVVGEILGHGHARNRQSDGFGSGLVANLCEKVLVDMNKAGELDKSNS